MPPSTPVAVPPAVDAPGGAARTADLALDGTVVLLATWTLVYHLALLVHLRSDVALTLEVLLLVVVVAWIAASRRTWRAHDAHRVTGRDGPGPSSPRLPVVVTVVAAVVAAAAMALDLPWVLVWVPWLVAAGAGTVSAWSRLGDRTPGPVPAGRDGVVALVWATALAVLSTVTLRPNPDDLYYVNLSQWVAAHGTFPLRDTLFSDLGFPMSSYPPMASYDGLTGAVAHLVGVPAGDVVYVVVPPVATFLSVLALWRLLRAWRVPAVALALSAALVFLLLDGTSAYGPPGNLFLTRLWQGKVILLCIQVPVLLVHALHHVERPSRQGLVRLGLGGIAAVGLSTTAIFLVPLIALATAAPLLATSRRKAAEAFAAMAAYPLAAGVVTKAVGGRSADDFARRRLYRFEPEWFGHIVFLTGVLALVAVLAVLVATLLVPRPTARLTTGLLLLATGITFIPGVTHLGYRAVGLGPTLWRVSWGCTIAALVGVAVARLAVRLTAPVRVVACCAALVVLAVGGSPIWAPDTSTALVAPWHWQRGDATRDVVAWILDHTDPGDVVLAPDQLAITIAVTTTEIKTVAPRDYFLDYLRDDPAFQYPARLALTHLVNGVAELPTADLVTDLAALDVAVACVTVSDESTAVQLAQAGYVAALTSAHYTCLVRSSEG